MIAIYTRQSLDKKDSISIETQIDYCKKEFPNANYKIYTDKGYSGKNTNRPDFERMMIDIKNNKIEKVVIYKLDRMSRSLLDFASIITVLQDHNVDFISCTEKFDTSSPIGRAMLFIIMVFAQLEREQTAARVKDNYYARSAKGHWGGGTAPYGLRVIKQKEDGQSYATLECISPYYEDIIIKLFDFYAKEGTSLADLQRYLTDELGNTEKTWETSKLSKLLRSPTYVKATPDIYTYYKKRGCNTSNPISDYDGIRACMVYGKRAGNVRKYTDVSNHVISISKHKGIVSAKQFLRCQYKLDKNKSIGNNGSGRHTWLTGLIKCGYCGYSLKVVRYKVKTGYSKYFKCSGQYNYKVCDIPKGKIRVEEIESIVASEIIKKLSSLNIANHKVEIEENNQSNEIKTRLFEIDEKINNLIDALADGNSTTIKYINQKLSDLESEKNLLENTLLEISFQASEIKNELPQAIDDFKDWEFHDFESKKRIASSLIEKVEVAGSNVKIHWKL